MSSLKKANPPNVMILLLKFFLICCMQTGFVQRSFAIALDSTPESAEQRLLEEKNDSLDVYKHNLNYFISGQPDTKVQLSFKVRPFDNIDFFLAYTQTMFWELFTKKSSPFSDLNFNPEGFYRLYTDYGILKGIDIGAEHKSNGRDKEDSRSWNRSYVTGRTEFPVFGYTMSWNTKLFYLYDLDKTNRDIRRKLGFIETTIGITDVWQSVLRDGEIYLSFIPGGSWDVFDSDQGSQELGFKFRLPFKHFDPYIYFQVFNGINESQLFYKESRTSYRIGFAI